MTIPTYEMLMGPVLGLVLNEPKHYTACATELVPVFNLTQEEVEEMVGSGVRTTFVDRVYWATTYMKAAGVLDRLERPRKGYVFATERGRSLYEQRSGQIDMQTLAQFPEFMEFRRRGASRPRRAGPTNGGEAVDGTEEAALQPEVPQTTPSERIAVVYAEINSALRADLLAAILGSSPAFFERLILRLMIALGYGNKGAEQHLGRSGDGGIDGSVKQDPLGLNAVYLQAKRYASDNPVNVDEVRVFADALNEREDTAKGVFVTTSSFTRPARERATRSTKRLVLIDGEELTRLLIEYDVGVVPEGEPLVVKTVDANYFSE